MRPARSLVAATVLSMSVLSACGAAAPPAKELADEIIETLDVGDDVKACMHDEVAGFELTPEQAIGFSSLDDVAAKAAGGNEIAIGIMAEFQAALAACN